MSDRTTWWYRDKAEALREMEIRESHTKRDFQLMLANLCEVYIEDIEALCDEIEALRSES